MHFILCVYECTILEPTKVSNLFFLALGINRCERTESKHYNKGAAACPCHPVDLPLDLCDR